MKRISALLTPPYRWLPDGVDRRVRAIGWLILVFQVVLVGTGGAVRLTGSGLGCPTWPRCTADSLVSTPALGVNGLIEFGNRLLTVVLVIVVVLTVVLLLRIRNIRKDLFLISILTLASIPLQAVIGGLSVLSHLNPYVVGLHFVVSIALVALATVFVYRSYQQVGPRRRIVPVWLATIAHATSLFVAITIAVGILTTGSGPHAGDAHAPRNGLNPEILQHLHSFPAYAVFVLTVVVVIAAVTLRVLPLRRYAIGLLVIEVLQIAVGLAQANLGLPVLLVGIHMVLASLLTAAMTAVELSLRANAASGAVSDVE
ncbi:MAG: COX15/CtaA family protein [Lacisediminihabitans sp.]